MDGVMGEENVVEELDAADRCASAGGRPFMSMGVNGMVVRMQGQKGLGVVTRPQHGFDGSAGESTGL